MIPRHLNNVTNIDDKRVGGGLDPDPLAIRWPPDIETPNTILIQNSQCSRVLVAADTKSKIWGGAWRVVVEADEAGLIFEAAVQSLRWQV